MYLGLSCWPSGKESVCKAGNQVQSLGWENPLEKEMATHSSTLDWRIPWTEEPGGYSPWGQTLQKRLSSSRSSMCPLTADSQCRRAETNTTM